MLVWGTTYPEFSKTYYETVCTGAIDEKTGRLIRIYPVQLRHMSEPFSLYQWIEAEVERNSADFRPESYKIRLDGLTLGAKVDTKNDWQERSKWVLSPNNIYGSLEDLLDAEKRDHTSLGLVRPKEIIRIYAAQKDAAAQQEWQDAKARAQGQQDLFADATSLARELEFVSTQYRVKFICDHADCHGHDCSLLDWGLHVLHRKLVPTHGLATAQEKVIAKVREIMNPNTHTPYFYMGNAKAHPRSFFVVGFYYPPKPKKRVQEQPGLFDDLQVPDLDPCDPVEDAGGDDVAVAVAGLGFEAQQR